MDDWRGNSEPGFFPRHQAVRNSSSKNPVTTEDPNRLPAKLASSAFARAAHTRTRGPAPLPYRGQKVNRLSPSHDKRGATSRGLPCKRKVALDREGHTLIIGVRTEGLADIPEERGASPLVRLRDMTRK